MEMAREGEIKEGDEIFRNQCGMRPTKSSLSMCSPWVLQRCFTKLSQPPNYLWFVSLKTPKDFQLSVLGSINCKYSLRKLVIDRSPQCFFLFFMYTILNGSCINGTEERPYNGRNTCGWPAFETWSGDRAPFPPNSVVWSREAPGFLY